MNKLKSLKEYNDEITRRKDVFNVPAKNGIACPICSEELVDSHPNEVLSSYPAKKRIKCTECHYKGYKLI